MDGYLTRVAVIQEITRQHMRYETLAKRIGWPVEYLALRLGGRIPLTDVELGELAAGLRVDVVLFLDAAANGRRCQRCGAVSSNPEQPVHWTTCTDYKALHAGVLIQPTIDNPLELAS